jgi:hypothetical protein
MVNFVALTNAAVCPKLLKVTVEVLRKFVPLMARVCSAAPAVAEVGDKLLIVGARLFTVKFTAVEFPPPGAGFVTTTGYVPAAA